MHIHSSPRSPCWISKRLAPPTNSCGSEAISCQHQHTYIGTVVIYKPLAITVARNNGKTGYQSKQVSGDGMDKTIYLCRIWNLPITPPSFRKVVSIEHFITGLPPLLAIHHYIRRRGRSRSFLNSQGATHHLLVVPRLGISGPFVCVGVCVYGVKQS